MASCHTHATCCQSSHRIHRSFWRRILSHGFHGSTQKLVPLRGCTVSSAPAEQEVHQPSRRAFCFVCAAETAAPLGWRCGYGRMPYPPNLCASVPICGRLSLPEGSVCSACSVGTLFLFALLVLQRQLHQRGSILPRISRISTEVRLRYWRRGYGRDAIPS